ncbi:MAG: HipA domain-containing protein [bacterium]|nr:HipA domain-containing protein [bacterium]
MSPQECFVYFDHLTLGPPPLMGRLSISQTRGKSFFTFAFDPHFMKTQRLAQLDPELHFYAGPQYTNKANFGLFLDSAPDRWGRRLMQRREALLAQQENRPPRKLQEPDYLLGVYDETRMGAIRFKMEPTGPYQSHLKALATPPWTYLRELEEACRKFDHEQPLTDEARWLSMLIAPGSSLGGARPKANVLDPQGALWIAKFPSKTDDYNVAAWEYLTTQMARDAGLRVPHCKLEKYSKYGSTFLTQRFDRQDTRRLHFASAMTLLGKTDGAHAQEGASYLELAAFITQQGHQPTEDLEELWRRIVFSIAVSNTDDHLRNHGFLLSSNGWRLSPAYDINPNPEGQGLSLNLSETSNALDFGLALEVAPAFRLTQQKANAILHQIRTVVARYADYASALHLSRYEISQLAPAFNV